MPEIPYTSPQKKSSQNPQSSDGNLGGKIKRFHEEANENSAKEFAKKINKSYIDLIGFPIDHKILEIIPEEIARQHRIVAYMKNDDKILVATTNPKDEEMQMALDELSRAVGMKFETSVASERSIQYALKLYELFEETPTRNTSEISFKKVEKKRLDEQVSTLQELREEISKTQTTEALDIILKGAIATGATDVHIEPQAKEARVRYRIDGVLQEVVNIPSESYKALLSRIKFLAKVKLDINRLPQDGKFHIEKEGHRVDIRVSTIPASYGESIEMRLLDTQVESIPLEDLGLQGDDIKKISHAVSQPNGIILITGPTGSGKTTTMYAMLERVNKPGVKIITLEDPVEYDLPGVIQSQVRPDVGYDFANGLRSILRQDPDILMVGEIRDRETGEMAVNAALTGHLLLSTLHTNDSFGALPRLIEMGVEPFLIADAINLIISQRLVRKICSACKTEEDISAGVREKIKEKLGKIAEVQNIDNAKFYTGRGCDSCNNTGYHGRTGIFEILQVTKEIEGLVASAAPIRDIKSEALKSGMLTMEQDGILKAISGITSLEEVFKVTKEQ